MSNSIEKLAKEAERLAENLQGNPFPAFDRIAKDIQERQDNAIAMEFTKCIGELLRKNGVVPKLTEYTRNFETDKTFETRYGVSIDELDFSEHDKVFEDKIADLQQRIRELIKEKDEYKRKCNNFGFENQELKQRIAELESREMENFSDINTSNPLACAESLIEHMTHCEKFMIMPERDVQTFSVEELKEIADYLMVYYKHHKDRDAEDTISF